VKKFSHCAVRWAIGQSIGHSDCRKSTYYSSKDDMHLALRVTIKKIRFRPDQSFLFSREVMKPIEWKIKMSQQLEPGKVRCEILQSVKSDIQFLNISQKDKESIILSINHLLEIYGCYYVK
jgi:hypothetical protein